MRDGWRLGRGGFRFGLLAAGIALGTRAAGACPGCFPATGASTTAYLATAAFLALLPLVSVAGLVLWIGRRRPRRGRERQA